MQFVGVVWAVYATGSALLARARLRHGGDLRPGDGQRLRHRPLHRRRLARPRLCGALFPHLDLVGAAISMIAFLHSRGGFDLVLRDRGAPAVVAASTASRHSASRSSAPPRCGAAGGVERTTRRVGTGAKRRAHASRGARFAMRHPRIAISTGAQNRCSTFDAGALVDDLGDAAAVAAFVVALVAEQADAAARFHDRRRARPSPRCASGVLRCFS